jgi:uncharacterized membrane protein YkoI
MQKPTVLLTTGASLLTLAIATAIASQKVEDYGSLAAASVDLANAASIVYQQSEGTIVEAELEMEDGSLVWEVEMVDAANNLIKFDVDGSSGEILSTRIDDDGFENNVADAITLNAALELISPIEQGVLIEAELEHEDDGVVWEFELVNADNKEVEIVVDALSGAIVD